MEGRHCEMDKASDTKSPPNLTSTRKKEATVLGGELVGEGGGRCAEVRKCVEGRQRRFCGNGKSEGGLEVASDI